MYSITHTLYIQLQLLTQREREFKYTINIHNIYRSKSSALQNEKRKKTNSKVVWLLLCQNFSLTILEKNGSKRMDLKNQEIP